jgi:hypothetical protein
MGSKKRTTTLKKFPTFYGTRWSITGDWCQFWDRWTQPLRSPYLSKTKRAGLGVNSSELPSRGTCFEFQYYFSWSSSWSFRSPPVNSGMLPQIMPQLPPFTSFWIHDSLNNPTSQRCTIWTTEHFVKLPIKKWSGGNAFCGTYIFGRSNTGVVGSIPHRGMALSFYVFRMWVEASWLVDLPSEGSDS